MQPERQLIGGLPSPYSAKAIPRPSSKKSVVVTLYVIEHWLQDPESTSI